MTSLLMLLLFSVVMISLPVLPGWAIGKATPLTAADLEKILKGEKNNGEA